MLYFDDEIKKLLNPKIYPVLKQVEEAANAFSMQAAKQISIKWPPVHDDIRETFNAYLDLLWASNIQKISLTTSTLITSVNEKNFLNYALTGRSLIEYTAVMRHYGSLIKSIITECVSTGSVSEGAIKQLIFIMDKNLRGRRFDWDTFLQGNFNELTKEYKGEDSQVNIKTCIDKWTKAQPEIYVLYSLFCDLVHPNVGSTLLVMKVNEKAIIFGGSQARHVGVDIFYKTFVGLAATIKEYSAQINELLSLYFPVGKYVNY